MGSEDLNLLNTILTLWGLRTWNFTIPRDLVRFWWLLFLFFFINEGHLESFIIHGDAHITAHYIHWDKKAPNATQVAHIVPLLSKTINSWHVLIGRVSYYAPMNLVFDWFIWCSGRAFYFCWCQGCGFDSTWDRNSFQSHLLIDWLTILFQFGNTLSTITIFGGRAIYTSFMHHSYI